MSGLIVDLFAGGGGASTGIEAALNRRVDLAVNHSATALAVHEANHSATKHLVTGVFEVDPVEVTRGRRVDLLWASPDCTQFSIAKGGKPKSKKIRSLAEVVVQWAQAVRPRVIFTENVREFLTWGPLDDDGHPIESRAGELFERWRGRLELLGYDVEWRMLDASGFGAPTRRKRLFIVARCDGQPITWPEPTHGPGRRHGYRTAAECIDWSLPCPSIFERTRPLAPKTLARIAAGVRRFVLEAASPFVIKVNHGGADSRVEPLGRPLGTVVAGGAKHALVSAFLAKHFGGVVGTSMGDGVSTVTTRDHHSLVTATLDRGDHTAEVCAFLAAYYGTGVGQSLGDPLRTVVSKDRFGLVVVDGIEHVITDIGMRMLEPHELLRAQFGRFAESYDLSAATTKAAKVRLIGNSVCPEVAEALVRANTQHAERRAA